MTPNEIDKLIDLYADDGGPGLIKLSADTWCRMPMDFGAACINPLRGIRYRGVRILVSRAFEDQVLSRADALALGHDEFEELMPAPERTL
jgi:hypothetical protein